MTWILLLHLLCEGTLTGAALEYDPILNQIIAPLPANAGSDFVSRLSSPVNVDFGLVRADDIVYKKKTLCGQEAQSVINNASRLTAIGHSACEKEAAAQALNSFYLDKKGNCFGSDILVQGEGGTCSFNQLVIYSSDTPLVDCDVDPIPNVRNFVVGDFNEDVTSFVATFEPVCPGAFLYELQLDGFMFDDVAKSGRRVPDYRRVHPCTEYSRFALQPYDEEGNYDEEPIYAPPVTTPGDCARIDNAEPYYEN